MTHIFIGPRNHECLIVEHSDLIGPILSKMEPSPDIHCCTDNNKCQTYGHGAKVQHQGLGKRLIKQAEDIARLAGYKKLAMISGVGVRGYYRRLGYKLNKTYLLKNL